MGGIGSVYPPRSAMSMYNASSSRSCLEWAAQRKNTCSCPTNNFQRICFLLLEDTDVGEVFVKTWETKKCTLDDFSAAYIAKYKVAGPDDPEAIVLQQVAQSVRMDVADIESRHASSRRMLKSVVQTHMLNKANMSAHVVGRSLAKRQQRAGGRGVVSVVATRQERSEGSYIKKRRAVRSAWATFTSEQSAGKKADFRELSDKYRNSSHADRTCPRRETGTQGMRYATFAGQTASPEQVANGTMATLPTRAQPDLGVGQHVGPLQEPLAAEGGCRCPKEANREARFNMAMERGPASANAPFRSFDRPQQAMFAHQSCTTVH